MGAFLGVNQGSDTALRFLEISYTGGAAGDAPLALVGKGITFDSYVWTERFTCFDKDCWVSQLSKCLPQIPLAVPHTASASGR